MEAAELWSYWTEISPLEQMYGIIRERFPFVSCVSYLMEHPVRILGFWTYLEVGCSSDVLQDYKVIGEIELGILRVCYALVLLWTPILF